MSGELEYKQKQCLDRKCFNFDSNIIEVVPRGQTDNKLALVRVMATSLLVWSYTFNISWLYKTIVSPVQYQWGYCSLVLSHRYVILLLLWFIEWVHEQCIKLAVARSPMRPVSCTGDYSMEATSPFWRLQKSFQLNVLPNIYGDISCNTIGPQCFCEVTPNFYD